MSSSVSCLYSSAANLSSERVLRPMCFVKQLEVQEYKFPGFVSAQTPRTNLAKELEKYSKPPSEFAAFDVYRPIAPKPAATATATPKPVTATDATSTETPASASETSHLPPQRPTPIVVKPKPQPGTAFK